MLIMTKFHKNCLTGQNDKLNTFCIQNNNKIIIFYQKHLLWPSFNAITEQLQEQKEIVVISNIMSDTKLVTLSLGETVVII